MNYRNTALAEITALSTVCPEFTIGQLLLSIIKRKPEESPHINEWLRDISDEDLYTIIEEAKILERE